MRAMDEINEMNVRLLQRVAEQQATILALQAERHTLLAIVNSDCAPPSDYSDLGVWIEEMAKDFAQGPPVGNTEFSMWLHDWLCHIRASRQAGVVPSDGDDLDE